MCLFPIKNLKYDRSTAGSKFSVNNITEFKCGHCPECLKERANSWVTRAVYAAKEYTHSCMVTLTYDNYIRDPRGRIVGETLPDRDLHVCKRDVQLFIKRLRKYFNGQRIQYLLCAEYGSKTHRAHYHAILFGVSFPDLIPLKKSNRNHQIYKSDILTSIWNHGICTVDSTNINGAIARYCTKYCAKSRSEDTFMLFSHHLGLKALLEDFNGKSYVIEGREYPIPRLVWNKVIYDRYCQDYPYITYKYINKTEEHLLTHVYQNNCVQRHLFSAIKHSDPQYNAYFDYWQSIGTYVSSTRPPVTTRIRALPDLQFATFKIRALEFLSRHTTKMPYDWRISLRELFKLPIDSSTSYPGDIVPPCRINTCLNAASDTKRCRPPVEVFRSHVLRRIETTKNSTPPEFSPYKNDPLAAQENFF